MMKSLLLFPSPAEGGISPISPISPTADRAKPAKVDYAPHVGKLFRKRAVRGQPGAKESGFGAGADFKVLALVPNHDFGEHGKHDAFRFVRLDANGQPRGSEAFCSCARFLETYEPK